VDFKLYELDSVQTTKAKSLSSTWPQRRVLLFDQICQPLIRSHLLLVSIQMHKLRCESVPLRTSQKP
jgi:hypothetical protein